MSNFVPKKQHLREVLLHYFVLKKTPAETHRVLVEAYGEHAPHESTCTRWFKKFEDNDFDVEDKERTGRPKKFEDEELEALLDEDPCQTETELANALNVTQQCISQRLHAMGMVQKQEYWVPHELSERNIANRLTICELLFQRQKRKSFLHRIVTGDEKWIHYDNPKRKKAWLKPGEPGPSRPKQDIHGSKVMLCIWWDQQGVIYYELLQPNQTITAERYLQQLINLSEALKEKRREYAKRHDKVISGE